ncbi:hypothetical protein OE88DRAFT_1605098, partial [Heliocybe sulcata]
GDKSLKLWQYELEEDDWDIIADLVRVLQIFKTATLFFSQDTVASIANVIPTMDMIDKMLTRRDGHSYHPAIPPAMQLAKATINCYYSCTDDSDVYQIAMVLHPGLKLEYFRKHDWEPEWIATA